MQRRFAFIAAGLMAILLAPATVPAMGLTAEFAIRYVHDTGTQSLTYEKFGEYSAAVDCRTNWERRTSSSLNLDKPLLPDTQLEPIEMTETSTASTASAASTIVTTYYAYPTRGELRVVEETDGKVTSDYLYRCSSFTLNTGPADLPTSGLVTVTYATTKDVTCNRQESILTGLMPLVPKDGQPFAQEDTDRAACITLAYVGMIPPEGEDCPTYPDHPCVPFSGKFFGRLSHADGSTMLEADPCRNMIVGGFCWGGAPDDARIKDFRPCDCLPFHAIEANFVGSSGTWKTEAWRLT